MQYVNDDMDELFKRAAENYPLDTNSANWNKVLAALQNQTEVKTVSEKKGNNNRRLLWLLLLLSLGLICNQLYSPGTVNSKGISKGNVQDETLRSVVKTDQQKDNSKNGVATNSNVVTANNDVTITSEINKKRISRDEPLNTLGVSSLPAQKTSSQFYAATSKNRSKAYSPNGVSKKTNSKGLGNNDDFENDIAESYRKYVSEIAFSKILENVRPNIFNRKFDPLISSREEDSKQPVHVARRKRFYGGIMGAVDVTTIKFQKVEDAGKTYGLLLGYQLNKRWSIESGVYIEKKYYYTEGKYFDAKKIYPSMPSNFWLDNISGDCKMIEIPVSLKYNLVTRKNSGWFATVGTSSYLMKKERYAYDYYYGSNSSYGRHEKDFTNSTKNFFSNIGISAGYTHRLGNFADLRVEPYLKLPVSKMGIGNLPLFSTGLQVGLTRKF